MLFSKPLQTPGANAAAITSAALISQQVAGKAVRDAFYLSSFDATTLPRVMAAAAVLSLLVTVWLSRVMARHPPAAVMPVMFAVSTGGLLAEWGLSFVSSPISAIAVYFHTALFGPALIATFWSLINERFDPHTAKRAVSRIASGGTLGGVLGGLAAWRASSILSLPTVVLCLAGLNLVCFVGTLFIRAPKDSERKSIPPPPISASSLAVNNSALHVFKTTPFLRALAILVALGAASSSILDYVFSIQATAAYEKGAPLLAFFSLFWVAVSVLSFLLQLLLGRIAMEKLGLAVNIAVLPGVIIMGSAFGIAVPGLLSCSILRGAEAVQRNTLFRSAYELLYTPLSEARKRTTKVVIDVGIDRLGTVLGSGVAIGVLYIAAQQQALVLLAVVVVLAVATLPVTRRLHVGYVAALEQRLRDGAKKLDLPPLEPSRLHDDTVHEEADAVARDAITLQTDAVKAAGEHSDSDEGRPHEAFRPQRALLAAGADLLSGDVGRMRRALAEWSPEKRPLTSFAILLLAHKELHVEARASLRQSADVVTGQLIDALLDPQMDPIVRRRMPRVLSACLSQRAVDGLVLGIADARFEVRFECGRALLSIVERKPDLVVPREKITEAILREAEYANRDVAAAAALELEEDAADAAEPYTYAYVIAKDRVDRRLEHVFTILSLLLEREPLRMAFRALHQEDSRHRGTALEYLQTVLPSDVRVAVWPFLGETEALTTARTAQEVLADLTRATLAKLDPSAALATTRAAS